MATASNNKESEKTQSELDPQEANPFSSSSDASDVILLVDKQQLHVSKLVLSLASPVFQRMFEADFKEKSNKEITLPNKKFEVMLEFLLCIYPSTCKPVTGENLNKVLPLAHEYQVQQLVDRCEIYILTRFENAKEQFQNPPIKELVHFLFLADRYGLPKLLKLCIEKMALRNYSVGQCAMEVPKFKMVSVKTKYEILEYRMRILEPIAKEQDDKWSSKDLRKCFMFKE